MHDHLLLFRAEQQAREAGARRPDAVRAPRPVRAVAGDRLIAIGLRLRGRPPDPWPRPVRG